MFGDLLKVIVRDIRYNNSNFSRALDAYVIKLYRVSNNRLTLGSVCNYLLCDLLPVSENAICVRGEMNKVVFGARIRYDKPDVYALVHLALKF